MFENLTERLSRTVQQLRGKGRLTEDGIKATLREVRIALLEADVALPVVQTFISEVREKALGQEVLQSLTPGQAMVKLVHDELVQIMGVENEALDLKAQPPVTVLMAGLQGSGKTTTTAKLARLLDRAGEKARDGSQLRRVPPGGHRAAQDPGRPGRGHFSALNR